METVEKHSRKRYYGLYIFGLQKDYVKVMTVSVALFGLVPILWSTGTGADVMIPITVPLIGTNHFNYLYISNCVVLK
jgi:hypothetical protein